jgi:hypothetical protein
MTWTTAAWIGLSVGVLAALGFVGYQLWQIGAVMVDGQGED